MDKIAKQRLNLILLIDCSKSMQGRRIKEVNSALKELKSHLLKMQNENSNTDFYISVITFGTDAQFLNGATCTAIDNFDFQDIKCGGWSNLHTAYERLAELLQKESRGGIMPDFGGVAPIVLLMTDGHPTKYPLREELNKLKALPWFSVALKYGIAIELNDERTLGVLRDFSADTGEVIECFDASILEKMIRIIVLSASKVKSQTTSVSNLNVISKPEQIRQQIKKDLLEVYDWEW